MATVHEAWIDGPDGFARRVALKRVREGAHEVADLAKLFSDEARIASHLHHANLVAILDYGVEGEVPFQALELVDGTTLEALQAHLDARGEPFPEAIAIHVAREVAHGLGYAHRATDASGKALGLVHRDVSPSNVLIGWNGDVKLSDFGIAFARGRQVETAHGVARGKPSYMAPEQATRGTIDARTDLFALGCTLHFALTGKSPLEGDEVLLKMLVGERAPLEGSLAPDLAEIVGSAVAPEKRERPASGDAMNEKLDAAYRARSTRDGKTELRAWLAPIAKRLRAAGTGAGTPSPSPSRSESRSPSPLRSRSSWGVVAVVTMGVAALGVALGTGGTAPTAAPPTSVVVVVADAGTVAVLDAFVAPALAIDAAVAPPPSTVVAPHPAHLAAPRTVVAPEPDTATGFVRVVAGCDDARGGEVMLDGRATGDHVPTTLRVRSGSHRIRVTAADGRTFEDTVSVTSFHTEGSPAWFRACAAAP
jgi:hypothetical protein